MTPGPVSVVLRRPRTGERRLGECERAALHAALALAGGLGVEAVAFTLGNPREDAALQVALRAGCARATRIDDRGARRVDYLATARALAHAIRQGPPGLVVAGDRSSDNHGGAVGPALAHWLEVPHLAGVVAAEVRGEAVEAVCRTGGALHRFRVPLPAVLCVASFAAPPLARGRRRGELIHLDLAELDLERDELEARARAGTTPTRRTPARARLIAEPAALTGHLVADGLLATAMSERPGDGPLADQVTR